MKIVVTVDSLDLGKTAATLAARLAFAHPQVYELVHVVEPLSLLSLASAAPNPDAVVGLVAAAVTTGERALTSCRETLLSKVNAEVRTTLRQGGVASELIQTAADRGAVLIAAGGARRGVWHHAAHGSVIHKLLARAPSSLLLAKNDLVPDRPLRAVFATDHSPYAGRCADLLAEMAPQGLGTLTVFTAIPAKIHDPLVRGWLPEHAADANRRVMTRLEGLHCEMTSRVGKEPAIGSIMQVLDDENADLLILGAQGHGWFHRAFIGSVSHALATQESRHLLVLRP